MNKLIITAAMLSVSTVCPASRPASAKLAAENNTYKIYINEERPSADEFSLPVSSLWVSEKATGREWKLLTTNPQAETSNYDYKSFSPISAVDIASAEYVLFFPYNDSKVIVSGKYPSFTFVSTFLIDLKSGEAMGLPVSGGVVGFTGEKGFAIGETWDYYDEGGRYDVLKIFDDEGKHIATFSLKGK